MFYCSPWKELCCTVLVNLIHCILYRTLIHISIVYNALAETLTMAASFKINFCSLLRRDLKM